MTSAAKDADLIDRLIQEREEEPMHLTYAKDKLRLLRDNAASVKLTPAEAQALLLALGEKFGVVRDA